MSSPSYTKTVEIPVSKLPCTVQLYTVATPLENKVATEAFDFNVQRKLDVMTLRSDNTVVDDKEHGNGIPSFDNPAGTSLSEALHCLNLQGRGIMTPDSLYILMPTGMSLTKRKKNK